MTEPNCNRIAPKALPSYSIIANRPYGGGLK